MITLALESAKKKTDLFENSEDENESEEEDIIVEEDIVHYKAGARLKTTTAKPKKRALEFSAVSVPSTAPNSSRKKPRRRDSADTTVAAPKQQPKPTIKKRRDSVEQEEATTVSTKILRVLWDDGVYFRAKSQVDNPGQGTLLQKLQMLANALSAVDRALDSYYPSSKG